MLFILTMHRLLLLRFTILHLHTVIPCTLQYYPFNHCIHVVLHYQWSNYGGTRGNGVTLPFLAGEHRSLAYTTAIVNKGNFKSCIL